MSLDRYQKVRFVEGVSAMSNPATPSREALLQAIDELTGGKWGAVEVSLSGAAEHILCRAAELDDATPPTPPQGAGQDALLAAGKACADALRRINCELPISRDWLDPTLEKFAIAAIAAYAAASAPPDTQGEKS